MPENKSKAAQGQNDSAREYYQAGVDRANAELGELQAAHRTMVWIRTALFLATVLGLLLGYAGDVWTWGFLTIGWLSFVGFFAAIVRHEHLRLAQVYQESDLSLFRLLLARMDRRWEDIPAQELLPEFDDVAYADDLDIAGPASLLGLLSLTGTLPGKTCLQSWLARPAGWEDVLQRQAAVQRLMPDREFRLQIIRTIRASSDGNESGYGLPDWAASPDWLPTHRFAHILSYVGPVIVALGAIAIVVCGGWEDKSYLNYAAALLGLGFVINIGITMLWGSWIHDIFLHVTGEHRAVYQFAEVFAALGELPDDGGLLETIRKDAVESESNAQQGFEKLLWNVRLANFQKDPTLYVVYLAFQLVFLWDFRVLKRLERWKQRYGADVRSWFDGLGRCEALISAATLADENPEWTFPTDVEETGVHLEAVALGHPLIADVQRVSNDLRLEASAPLLLVTGSNMAGKSTFMRALGLNMVLARTGAPVCAETFRLPMVELASSIRVRDSLKDGVSFFMAELNRLKEVVDVARDAAARRRDGTGSAPIFFLLDEVLQGTNSNERQIAVARVVRQLLESQAVGVVSTHDLDLASAQEIRDVSQVVHFREYFEESDGREVMRFDYIMRPGPTPTTNALKLLKLVGLDQEP